jgi:leucyl-tRNA synthetase
VLLLDIKKIEKKWQKKWEKKKIFEANVDKKKKKFFITIPYPYVNGAPHIGGGFTFFRGDAYARFKRMQGFNVLLPQGFHATGEPILGTIERLKNKDQTQIETFKLYGATDEDIKNFVKKGPEFTARFWMKKWIEVLKQAGFSYDWRRTFITAITPTYNRFVEWQYNTLRKKDYVVQGTHPVIWCPKDQSPTGDHDRLKGEGESPIEYTVIKFKLDSGEVIPCATLRPETVYGVTNIWINPEAKYVGAEVDGESWIISEKAAEKLKDQLHEVKIIAKISPNDLIGKFVQNPIIKEKILMLPASFVDPLAATGIVMSVPAHAPYDWIGLKDLQKNDEEMEKYGLDKTEVRNIKPISLIRVQGFGEFPAVEISDKMKIANQKEVEKLEKATNDLYSKEFHTGVLKELYGNFAGKKVSEIKEQMIKQFAAQNAAMSMWEATAPVVCRCTTLCHVKILENQWFLKFSDEEWKDTVRYAIKEMKFYPDFVRQQFLNTVDWLKDKACTRKSGLGTRLPWDKNWIVETLSDSTIYMAYYTISRIINEKKIPAEKLTDEVFDFIFQGNGSADAVAKKVKLNEKILKKIREEFEYFYPVDLRTSGKDLLQNHLTFYLFHHTAIFDEKFWPEAIAINGFVNVSGTKMSKSKGNIIPMKDLIDAIGADLVRINIVASNEGVDDGDWRDDTVSSYKERIDYLCDLVSQFKKANRNSEKTIDRFLQSRIQQTIKKAAENYEQLNFRSASQAVLMDTHNDLRWYLERVGEIKNANRQIFKEALTVIVSMLAPLAPHVCEEMWEKLGNKNFVTISAWPQYSEKLVDEKAVENENQVRKTMEDLRNVLKLAGKKKKLYLYFVTDKEFANFKDVEQIIKKNFGFSKVEMFLVSDEKKYDPQNKSAKAKFGKPGIYLE